ncbi:MAG: ABC transporter ATP-binding protein [Alphaproteobacteria bacterium]|nr:ABC transporter ATP-binding protein [Alphaproteobacteria bacterium]
MHGRAAGRDAARRLPSRALPPPAGGGGAVSEAILSVRALRRWFPVRGAFNRRRGWVKALDDVSFDLRQGEILGLVGESGCGKSTLGKTIMGIHQPDAGEIWFEGRQIAGLSPAASRPVRRHLQYAYQDPGASLDPRWKIGRSLHEPLVIHTDLSAADREARVREILKAVGLPQSHLDLYPHEISGGQQRRVGLARILTLHPKVVILDEPTSGLDVSVQATVLALFRELRDAFELTYMFVSHDLAVVRMMCSRVAVMYLGRVVEIGPTDRIFAAPQHHYTRSLLAAIPQIGGPRVTRDFWLKGEPPDPANLPSGCRFRTRCPRAEARCAEVEPVLAPSGDREVACHFPAAPEGPDRQAEMR